jgi:AmiR/NasT family two-component response regulator
VEEVLVVAEEALADLEEALVVAEVDLEEVLVAAEEVLAVEGLLDLEVDMVVLDAAHIELDMVVFLVSLHGHFTEIITTMIITELNHLNEKYANKVSCFNTKKMLSL